MPLSLAQRYHRGVPFVVCASLPVALLALPGPSVSPGLLTLGIALTVLLVAAALFVPWRTDGRLPALVGGLVYLGTIALLREAGGGNASGFGPLVLVPVIWFALYRGRVELVLSIIGAALVYWVPLIVDNGTRYPSSGWRIGLIFTAVSAMMGFAIQRLQHDLRRQAAQLDADLQRERVAFDDAPIGSALVSVEGRYLRVNPALCAMTGFAEDELLGKHTQELTHPDDLAADVAPFAALLAGTLRDHHADKRYLRRDGTTLHAKVAVTAIYDGTQRPAYFYAQIQDVSESTEAAERIQQAQFETLSRLAGAAEYRDDKTGEHTRRVGALAGALAEARGLEAGLVRLIRLAAPLHDVGKIGIPDAILLKPGKLTAAEFALMQQHTSIGAQMLSGGVFPEVVIAEQIAANHHERWDGTGYPAGLSGEAIPIAARIVAVVDVFDALTHARPYKEAWTLEASLAELAAQAGRQFDPQVIAAFLALQPVQPEAPATASDALTPR
jgi:PAS domain S-box-containing protein/putative nucleotidyltransferase with HDIG domain